MQAMAFKRKILILLYHSIGQEERERYDEFSQFVSR
jgi:hypothetical protein